MRMAECYRDVSILVACAAWPCGSKFGLSVANVCAVPMCMGVYDAPLSTRVVYAHMTCVGWCSISSIRFLLCVCGDTVFAAKLLARGVLRHASCVVVFPLLVACSASIFFLTFISFSSVPCFSSSSQSVLWLPWC